MTSNELRNIYIVRNATRQKCRTDLLKLCVVLGYKDVNQEVHGPLIDSLQKFPGGKETEVRAHVWKYEPFIPHWQLTGSRRNLFLYPRSHLKTSVITIAHSIQWIINYPNIRILISTATGDQAELVLGSILTQFRYNPDFRALFPEFCPRAEKAADFGSKDAFTVANRSDLTLKEPTVRSCTVGKVIAGSRADVIKNSDLVDEQNVKTPGGIKEVISHFGHMEPLMEGYSATPEFPASRGWNDVEGTRYDFGDLYAGLIKSPDWHQVIRSAISDDGKALWPARFPLEALEMIRRQPHVGDWIFSAQYLNKCVPQGDGLCDPKDVAFVPGEVIRGLLPQLRVHCTVDLAGMEPTNKGDYTAVTVGGFDRDGRLYIIEMHCGRPSPEEVIGLIFSIYARYPNIVDFKVEKDAHARVLLPFLQREMSKRQRFPVLYPIKRDTHTSKQHRIRGLRPWFKTGIIRFNADIPLQTKQELLEEVAQFPSESSGVHDDVLDTLADLMQNRDGDGVTDDVIADSPDQKFSQFGVQRGRDRFLGFREDGVADWLFGPDSQPTTQRFPTGIM